MSEQTADKVQYYEASLSDLVRKTEKNQKLYEKWASLALTIGVPIVMGVSFLAAISSKKFNTGVNMFIIGASIPIIISAISSGIALANKGFKEDLEKIIKGEKEIQEEPSNTK